MYTSFFKFAWLKYTAPASDDIPKGNNINCKLGDDLEKFSLYDSTCNKPIASHNG